MTGDLVRGFILESLNRIADVRQRLPVEERTLICAAAANGLEIDEIARVLRRSQTFVRESIGEQVLATGAAETRRLVLDDVLVVASNRLAWRDYEESHAYICQSERTFRPSARLVAWYHHARIEPVVAEMRHHRDNVELSLEQITRLEDSGDPVDAEFADIVRYVLDQNDPSRILDTPKSVYLLTKPGDAGTIQLKYPVRHLATGRGSAWAQGHRYACREALERSPKTTAELEALTRDLASGTFFLRFKDGRELIVDRVAVFEGGLEPIGANRGRMLLRLWDRPSGAGEPLAQFYRDELDADIAERYFRFPGDGEGTTLN